MPQANIHIVDFRQEHAEAFRALNESWLQSTVGIGVEDKRLLNHPIEEVIHRGGFIFCALKDKMVVGCCALIAHGDDVFELAKMCVATEERGRGIGRMLGEAIIDKAEAISSKELFLDTNKGWLPAVRLYRALGFVPQADVPGRTACDLRMIYRMQ